jgi:hypothetical protein
MYKKIIVISLVAISMNTYQEASSVNNFHPITSQERIALAQIDAAKNRLYTIDSIYSSSNLGFIIAGAAILSLILVPRGNTADFTPFGTFLIGLAGIFSVTTKDNCERKELIKIIASAHLVLEKQEQKS